MKRILGILIALIISTKAFASVTVMPTRVEFNANKTRANYLSTSIDIKGDERQVMRFKVYPGFFKISEKNEMVQLEGQTAPNDLSKKIKYVPSEFTVQPGKSQKLRVNVIGINSLPDGESRCVLYIEDVNPKEVALDTRMQGIGAQLIVKTRVGVPIYVDKGKVEKNCEIQNFSIKEEKNGLYLNAKLVNSGNSRIRYNTQVQVLNDKKLVKEIPLKSGTVGDNNYFNIKDKLDTKDIPPGEYTLRYIVSFTDGNGKKQNVKQETQIQI